MKNYAYIDSSGNKYWYKDNYLQRDNGPAMEYANGDKLWYQKGLYHRLDGPAVLDVDGSFVWYKEGKLHRLDGPAIKYKNNDEEWWFNDEQIKCNSQEEFLRLIKLKAFW